MGFTGIFPDLRRQKGQARYGPDVMPNGTPGTPGELRPLWRNRKIIVATATGVAAVAAIIVAVAASGSAAPKTHPRAAGSATPAATSARTPAATPSASASARQSQPVTASSALASPPQAQPPARPRTAAAPANRHAVLITKAQLGTDWPLTVSSGYVRCIVASNAYTFMAATTGGRTYALNLAALKLGYPSITAVQIQSEDGTGEPADVSPLQERAANLC